MSARRRFTVAERRARLAIRHALARPVGSVEEAVETMVVLHATDPASVYLSALARVCEASLAAVERALYDDRSIVRVLAMRRTLFVVPVRYLGAVERSSAPAVATQERRRLETALAETGIEDPADWLAAAKREVEGVLAEGGAPARTLTRRSPALATKILMGRGTKHAVEVGATSRVLGLMAVEGDLMRGRPAGEWIGRQYEWHRRADWLDGGDESLARDPIEAANELVTRWLRCFGPAPLTDLKWWTGWRVTDVRAVLARLDVTEVDLDGATGLALSDDLEPSTDIDPWAALLPALDPTPMGWKEREWYLGEHRAPLFDRSGNIGPTIWVDGRIVGGWGQRPDGVIVTKLLEDVGADRMALLERRAETLQAQIGATVVRPSFPTPLQKDIYDNRS